MKRSRPDRYFFPSATRISDLDREPFEVRRLPRNEWRNGQYVAVEISGRALQPYELELADGRVAIAVPGDRLVGVLGRRAATLQAVGSWEAVGDDLALDLLTMAGVVGKCTSRSAFANPVPSLHYVGHIQRGDELVAMSDFAPDVPPEPLSLPVILIIGTSMDAGKTMAGVRIVRLLHRRGMRVAACKLTGVGRYRDVLAMGDAGAEWIRDFVDAGLPSTVVPADEFRTAVGAFFTTINALGADVAVIEAGASPLEPYNGEEAVNMIGDALRMVVLCASDPYAALGVMQAFELEPTFISGRATSTTAGAELTTLLTGRPAIDLLDPFGATELEALLEQGLTGPPPHRGPPT